MIKVLIVDDEEWIRQGLKEQIRWEALGLEFAGEASNGIGALEIIRNEHPDIVVTDIKMPIMDGIALMECVHREYPDTVLIVISGYSDFEYARKAITFKVFDYILKPIEEEKLEETLINAIEKIRENEKSKDDLLRLKIQLNESNALVKERFLVSLITGSGLNDEDIRQGIDITSLNINCTRMVIIIVKLLNIAVAASASYRNDDEKARLGIYSFIEDHLNGFANCVMFRNPAEQDELVLIKGFDTDEDRVIINEAYAMCKKILEWAGQFAGLQLYIGIGREFTDLRGAGKSYNQALEAVKNAGMIHAGGIIHIDEVSSRNDYYIYPDDKEKAFMYYLENNYKPQLLELIEGLFDEISSHKTVNSKSIRNTVLELTVGINKVLKKYDSLLEDLLHDYNFPNRIINDIFPIGELKEWLSTTSLKVIDFISGSRKTGNRRTIGEISAYLGSHYCEAISLTGIAEKYYMNPAYLCRVFKNETGQNFNEYLSRIRLEAAVELMKDARLKMNDISGMVGYENVNYFLKKFKDYFGCTPTEYKKNGS